MVVNKISNVFWINTETAKVIATINWQRTKEEIIWEFFWLKREVVYSDDWKDVLDIINEFKDKDILKSKWVKYIDKLWELWISEEDFYNIITKEYVAEQWNASSNTKSKSK